MCGLWTQTQFYRDKKFHAKIIFEFVNLNFLLVSQSLLDQNRANSYVWWNWYVSEIHKPLRPDSSGPSRPWAPDSGKKWYKIRHRFRFDHGKNINEKMKDQAVLEQTSLMNQPENCCCKSPFSCYNNILERCEAVDNSDLIATYTDLPYAN